MICTLEPAIQSGDTGQWIVFDSCQLTITWMSIAMSTIKLNTDCLCLGHFASNARQEPIMGSCARSLQENSQPSVRTLATVAIYYNEGISFLNER